MKVIQVRDAAEMSKKAASFIIDSVRADPFIKLGLATGSTPKGTYAEMVRDHKTKGTSYRSVKTINLDEYVGLPADDRNSFRHFMEEELFRQLDFRPENIHIPDGTAEDLGAECRRYDMLIEEHGGADIQLLGIGENGHIGFNEPGTSFQSGTHVVELTESTRRANARFFDSIEAVPEKAITMGIRSIFQSAKILLLVSGASKAEALARLVHGEIDERFPASVLKRHSNVTVIADLEACKLL